MYNVHPTVLHHIASVFYLASRMCNTGTWSCRQHMYSIIVPEPLFTEPGIGLNSSAIASSMYNIQFGHQMLTIQQKYAFNSLGCIAVCLHFYLSLTIPDIRQYCDTKTFTTGYTSNYIKTCNPTQAEFLIFHVRHEQLIYNLKIHDQLITHNHGMVTHSVMSIYLCICLSLTGSNFLMPRPRNLFVVCSYVFIISTSKISTGRSTSSFKDKGMWSRSWQLKMWLVSGQLEANFVFYNLILS